MPQDNTHIPPMIRSLMRSEAYQHETDDIVLVETHISWVLLTGSRAYKIKKPVDLGFVDFSTLEKRHFFCQEELRINRRLAPELYLEVCTLNGSQTEATVNGTGPILDYVVVMKQFAPELRLDRYLETTDLPVARFDRFARYLARFHQATDRATATDHYGEPAAITGAAQENFHQIRKILAQQTPETLLEVQSWTVQQGVILAPLFHSRKQQGYVRECHGDMHLGNMILLEQGITLFDAIEFNAELRWIDVISDIAFLIMDLQERAYRQYANCFLNAYLMHTGDFAGLSLLRYYLTYRAMVRAKVALLQAQQQPDDPQQRENLSRDFRTYLQLAHSYTREHDPKLIITAGYSGSGKSTVAAELAWRLDALHIRSDVERKRLAGLEPHSDSASALGQQLYSPGSSDSTYDTLLHTAKLLLKSGFTVIVDATFVDIRRREAFLELARSVHAEFHILHTWAGNRTLETRVQDRKLKADEVSEAGLEVLHAQMRHPIEWSDQELERVIPIDTTEAIDYDVIASDLRKSRVNHE